MTIAQQGAINTTAQIVPDLTVLIVPPQTTLLNGVPTNVGGVVGTACWGPVNSPTTIGDMTAYARTFGPVMARKYDAGTIVACAVMQGANNFQVVRVTDGTDTAASGVLTMPSAGVAAAAAAAINNGQSGMRGPSNFVVASASSTTLTITSKYTGSMGALISASAGAGSAGTSTRIVIGMPNQMPESFDNIGTASATVATVALTGGTDGAATITGSVLLGQDIVPRKGMYALRNTGTSVAALADCDDSTTWTSQLAFGQSEGIYMQVIGPAGDTISNAVTAKRTAGIDDYTPKVIFGDWVYWLDTANGTTRMVSPQGFMLGRLTNLSPEQSALNKPMYGIVATQKSAMNQTYSDAELQQLGSAGIDVITNPIPRGYQFGARFGRNASSNPVMHGDNYTRMTNYLASTLNAGMGLFVGDLQSKQDGDATRAAVKGTIDAFLLNLKDNGMIDDYQVICDKSNNSDASIALGYLQVKVKVIYMSVVEYLIVSLEGGQSVTITKVAA
jgi:hypothetical protein